MNWKKALLVLVVAGFALVFFAVAAVGLAATAGVTAAAIAISESGVVQAFEEVAEGAERLQIDVDGNSVTFTNPDSGESRVVVTDEHLGRGRVDFNLPEITVTDGESGERVVFGPGPRGEIEVTVPQITITDPDSGQSRVIRPSADFRAPRVVWDGDHYYGPDRALGLVGDMFQAMFTLAALVLIAAGAFLLLRNRRQAQTKLETDVDKTN